MPKRKSIEPEGSSHFQKCPVRTSKPTEAQITELRSNFEVTSVNRRRRARCFHCGVSNIPAKWNRLLGHIPSCPDLWGKYSKPASGVTDEEWSIVCQLKEILPVWMPFWAEIYLHYDTTKEYEGGLILRICHHCGQEVKHSFLLHLIVCPGPGLDDTWFKLGKFTCADCNEEVWNSNLQVHQHQCRKLRIRCGRCGAKIPRDMTQEHLKLWSSKPKNVGVLDVEYSPLLLPRFGHLGVFELALANADEDWIIPCTKIDHGMSVRKLADHILSLAVDIRSEAYYMALSMLKTHYGEGDWSERTSGHTWAEIAQMLECYTEKHGRLGKLLDWSSTNKDYLCLKYGLESVGRADLLPPEPDRSECPLSWWSSVRRSLKLDANSASLRLGKLFRRLYPEDVMLASDWHNAGSDVSMTLRIIRFFFDQIQGRIERGTLHEYWPGNEVHGDLGEESGWYTD
ncbi:uncharacterized protein BO97DRAFT_420564 [Aspergillus homomorphus CBS 101889]|uniref:Uncharacterized protein n=1 Tax=Aspergillus homomorphus (strain CBS 101889) TaxID=1450537 RepID=A0A395IDL7_ASPHC|nr:hypothetical protein BO97DRAFT_420564 [Aspergillus homomorphus CBS 101889]RAL16254.1 hypothetical protein BO97DRAFT_420564 [Aspergillus homomorphus CBS 101889]